MWLERICDRPELIIPVAENMRDWDRREIRATRFTDDPLIIANEAKICGQIVGFVAGLERPIAAFGGFEMWPGVWSAWLFATDEFGRIGISVTKTTVRRIIPMMWGFGAHRIESRSMEGHHEAQRWLEVIGARREATLHQYGRDREDFHTYKWERPNVR